VTAARPAAASPVIPTHPSLLIRDVRPVDGRGELLPHADLRIESGRIVAIGPGLAAQPGDAEWQAGGRAVVPGLMNAHVHVVLDGSADPAASLEEADPQQRLVAARARMASILASGVTTVRDLGGPDGVAFTLADEIDRGQLPGPRIVAAGRPICARGGHGSTFMSLEVDGPESAAAAARAQLAAGARVIKVMATGGMMTPGQVAGEPQLGLAEMRAVVEVAQAAGVPVAAHSEGIEGTLAAIEAGVSSIEHGHGLDERAIDAMLARGVALVPTLLSDEAILVNGEASGIPGFVVDACRRLSGDLLPGFRSAVTRGVDIVAGNDGGAPLVQPGEMAAELELYVREGMRPIDALRSATSSAARLLGVPDAGLLEPGAVADLVILDGDPVTDIGALRRVSAVLRDGRLVHRA
jgi:imidazolonepropionase-like amidohydrolase